MVGLQAYMSNRRHVSDTGCSAFEYIDERHQRDGGKDFLEDLWSRIQDLSNNGWKVDSVPRPHLSFGPQLVAGKFHDFAPLNCPKQPNHPAEVTGITSISAASIFSLLVRQSSSGHGKNGLMSWTFQNRRLEECLCRRFWKGKYGCHIGTKLGSSFFLFFGLKSVESAPALEELLPPKGTPNFRYSAEDEDRTEHDLSSDLGRTVKERATSREIISWIEDRVIPDNGPDVTLRVVVQTLLNIGSKSFIHLNIVLERYGQVIAWICADQDQQVMLIFEVSSFWKNNAQMTAIAIDRMMGYRLVSNLVIVRWVFSSSNVDQFHVYDRPWEVLRNAVNKTSNSITDLRKEIFSLKKSVVSASEAASKAQAEFEDAKSKPSLTLLDGEPVLAENPVKMKRLKSNADKTKEEEVSLHESIEAKAALLARAIDEALFLFLYKSFSNVLAEPLRDTDGTLHLPGEPDEMAIDHEDSSAVELDSKVERPPKSHSNGGRTRNGYVVGEKEQWCLSTLGYVKALSHQYATEIWPHIEKLDVEILTEDAHPLSRKAVYSGLRPTSDGI